MPILQSFRLTIRNVNLTKDNIISTPEFALD